MSDEDPFGLSNDAGRTRIRPRPSQGRPAQAQAPARAAPVAAPIEPGAPIRSSRATDNALVAAFAALLGIAPEMERATQPENPEVLRARLLENLIHSRDTAVARGVPLSRADQGAWFVGALLDDIAINTPWGGSSGWPRNPLVAQMYGNVDAGERFYALAEDLLRHPERDPQLLELVFLCLSLGFRGKHRVSGAAGDGAVAALRGQLARVLRDRDAEDAALSPHWKGVEADDEDRGFVVPLWSVGVLAVAVITGTYVGLGILLSDRGEQLYTLAEVLPPPERAEIFRPVIETVEPQVVLVAEPFVFEILPLFVEAAPPDRVSAITDVQIPEDVALAKLVVLGAAPEVFRSARADLNTEYNELIGSIGRTIVDNVELIGSVKVVGHTDSIPVQASNPFGSNQRLSEARAKTIADMLVELGVPAGLVSSEGRAASEPIADNGTREGRARNRRVEIVIQKKV
ncbi:type IVB secretion system protein IcmH/DotU [Jannaschia seohaensis]|uniref:Type VI secretion system protein ImpK n=1 Tax=Jannaschia seohaensis TaxID=475081 RepID=A0A2Y9AWY1_9RHOB|nr:type IVB secretion system protein IcmH/DotU [Jannaschia seohaensis]PWJ16553.1 type VI secretion system protein ImpK [Jannaschia seohaensis]SSA48790.1 type VI secretion system protein ImpK [Jannaschia seohaensis]